MSVVQPQKAPTLIPGVVTAASALGAIALAAVGSGAFGGTPVEAAAGGYLSSTATPVAPGVPAFSIWSVIYAGLLGYALWQLLPAARHSKRQQRIRPWAAASMLLNAAWLWAVQLGSLAGSLAIMLALLTVLCRILVLILAEHPTSTLEAVLSDGTFGLYLGWICVATVANAAAVLAWLGVGLPSEPTSAVVLGLAAAVGLALAARRAWVPLLSIAWGLAWIAVARTAGPLVLPGTAIAAGIAAVVVLAVGLPLALRPAKSMGRRRKNA